MLLLILLAVVPLKDVGQRIWQNECHGKVDKILFWSPHESFPSLGIGHFIWLPQDSDAPFEQTFPQLIAYFSTQGVKVPAWLKSSCPWKNRAAFLQAEDSVQMQELRTLLVSTIDLQTQFIWQRFEKVEQELHLSEKAQLHLTALKSTPQGVYALIDYLNFKGSGLSEKESYKGEGWGLKQVLEGIPAKTAGSNIVTAFVTSAKERLAKRVENSKPEAGEARWLKGWNSRLDSYEK